MAITRKSKFGFPPGGASGSDVTVRLVPLSQGVHQEDAWPSMAPGSSITMSNFVPMNGTLRPRSRLSSLNTIRTIPTVVGLMSHRDQIGTGNGMWVSGSTLHGLMVSSSGSISRASFVSAYGLGVAGVVTQQQWQYATIYYSVIDENITVAAGGTSTMTLLALHQTGGSLAGAPLYSFMTGAPQARCVGVFDNYLIAFHLQEDQAPRPTRVRWCQRGDASKWTQEGSGFEDLLDMRGRGVKVHPTADGRLLLFSTREIWQGLNAPYPAQFQFVPLDRTVGCFGGNTVCDTDAGVVFLGSDFAVRVLPHGGGHSEIISNSLSRVLQGYTPGIIANASYAVYDGYTKLYHLFIDTSFFNALRGIILNVVTGEWGFMDYNTLTPQCGTIFDAPTSSGYASAMFFGNSTGTVYSLSSTLSLENGSVVTSKWQSAPIGADLPGNYKQLKQVDCDYRANSLATVNVKLSQDGNTFGYTAPQLSLVSAPISGRATSQMYAGGGYPAIELTSTSTGYELHRLDVTLGLGGRRAQ